MGYFYFDDSVHDDGGFVTGVAIYSEFDLNDAVTKALIVSGFDSSTEEFKSGYRFAGNNKLKDLRHEIFSIASNCKSGLTFVDRRDRNLLYRNGLHLIGKIIDKNDFDSSSHHAYFDDGIFDANYKYLEKALLPNTQVDVNQNSKEIKGIQVADLVAHTCSIMLKEEMKLISKSLPVGPGCGYVEDTQVELGFEMWSGIRDTFFQGKGDVSMAAHELGYTSMVDYGLYTAEDISESLLGHVLSRFQYNYLGCIH